MPLIKLRKGAAERDAAAALYGAAVAAARRPVFYLELGVPDTLDGRFELLALHVFLILKRLREEGRPAKRLAQALFDAMFDAMDHGLRELGVGDLGVGRRVKTMAKALYGRIAAYEAGLAGGGDVLAAALARNLFGTVAAAPRQLAVLSAYLRAQAASLAAQSYGELAAGRVRFERLPAAAADTSKDECSDA